MKRLAAAMGAAPFVLVMIWGCAAAPKDAGLRDVQDAVRERSGFVVSWQREQAAETAAAERVRVLLSEELTERAAVEIALLGNRRLQATLEELGIARADLIQAGRPSNPVLGGEIRFPERPVAPVEFHVVQNLLDLIQLPRRRKLAAASFEQTRLRVADQVLDLVTDVRSAYIGLQATSQMTDLRREVAAAARAAAELAIRQHEAGNISDLELENEQALFEQARLELARSEEDIVGGRERLNALLGLWGDGTRWTIVSRLPDLPEAEPDLHGLESAAVARRLDLIAARREVEAAARAAGLARGAALGEFAIGVHQEREPDGTRTAGPSLDVPLPLFDRGGAARSRALAVLRQAEHRYAALAVEVRADIRLLRDRMLAARARAEYLRDVVLPRRSRIVSFSQQEYNFMLIGAFELLLARQNEIAARREHVEALRDYWIALAALERAASGSLEGYDDHGGH